MAMPIPPPMQRDTTPLRPPVLWSACNKVTSTLQPDMPMGWPREMAPPLTFTWGQKGEHFSVTMLYKGQFWGEIYTRLEKLDMWTGYMTAITALRHWTHWINLKITWYTVTLSTFRPSSLTTAIDWAANASLISNKSTWSSCQPAFSTYQRRTRPTSSDKGACSQLLWHLGASDYSPLSWWPVLVRFPW